MALLEWYHHLYQHKHEHKYTATVGILFRVTQCVSLCLLGCFDTFPSEVYHQHSDTVGVMFRVRPVRSKRGPFLSDLSRFFMFRKLENRGSELNKSVTVTKVH